MHKKALRILYWNARSLNKPKQELLQPILSILDIFVYVET